MFEITILTLNVYMMKVIPETALDICTFFLLIIYYSEVNMTDGVCFFTSIHFHRLLISRY